MAALNRKQKHATVVPPAMRCTLRHGVQSCVIPQNFQVVSMLKWSRPLRLKNKITVELIWGGGGCGEKMQHILRLCVFMEGLWIKPSMRLHENHIGGKGETLSLGYLILQSFFCRHESTNMKLRNELRQWLPNWVRTYQWVTTDFLGGSWNSQADSWLEKCIEPYGNWNSCTRAFACE